jgi:hypothetical protein
MTTTGGIIVPRLIERRCNPGSLAVERIQLFRTVERNPAHGAAVFDEQVAKY